jgi:luciferase family oxidoreductase group 1
VLDLAPVSSGRSSSQALQESIQLVQRVEELGYERFWVAEHHGMPGIASSAPAVLIAALAARTTRIRVGSGGVMLPNHPPLTVAEQFGTLAGLYPGRIDLGIGRAPGTDQRTAQLLRRGNVDDIPGEIQLVRAFFDGPVEASRPSRPRATRPRSGCWAPAGTPRSSPACWGCRSPSPTTSAASTRCRPSSSTARRSVPACSSSRTR